MTASLSNDPSIHERKSNWTSTSLPSLLNSFPVIASVKFITIEFNEIKAVSYIVQLFNTSPSRDKMYFIHNSQT